MIISFMTKAITLLYMLDSDIRRSESLNLFRSKVLKFILSVTALTLKK